MPALIADTWVERGVLIYAVLCGHRRGFVGGDSLGAIICFVMHLVVVAAVIIIVIGSGSVDSSFRDPG